MEQQIVQKTSGNLTSLVQDFTEPLPKGPAEFAKTLCTNLNLLKPANSETTQLITYVLLATAVVGIMVYQYIREQESL